MIILRDKTFAKRDYVGLSKEGAKALRAERKRLAVQLNKERLANRKVYEESIRDAEETIKRTEGMPERLKNILCKGAEVKKESARQIRDVADKGSVESAHRASNRAREMLKKV